MQFIIICSRDLLDWVVRKEVLANDRITLAPPGRAVALLGSPARVTGVRVRDEVSGQETELQAGFVVDATGRSSQAGQWLVNLGLTAPAEKTVDSGLTYATRIFHAPKGTPADFPLINVQADHLTARPGQTATLIPIENRRWLVTLSGTRGGEPPTDASHFVDFARGVRHPIVGDLIVRAHPDSPVYSTHSTANRRRYFERLQHWPDGFRRPRRRGRHLQPDLLATACPSQPAAPLHSTTDWHGTACIPEPPAASSEPSQARRRRVVDGNQPGRALSPGHWRTPHHGDAPPTALCGPARQNCSDRPAAAAAFYGAFALSKPMAQLVSPKAALATLLGPTRPALSAPPLSDELLFFARSSSSSE
ncbi:hypothetical protein SANTM175S_04465 [Streptomyces antimycoticus]